jgi:hypothetical protein
MPATSAGMTNRPSLAELRFSATPAAARRIPPSGSSRPSLAALRTSSRQHLRSRADPRSVETPRRRVGRLRGDSRAAVTRRAPLRGCRASSTTMCVGPRSSLPTRDPPRIRSASPEDSRPRRSVSAGSALGLVAKVPTPAASESERPTAASRRRGETLLSDLTGGWCVHSD